MKSDEPQSDADHSGRDGAEQVALWEQGEPLAGALTADGTRWRMERGATASVIERRLYARLQVWYEQSDGLDGLRVTALEDGEAADMEPSEADEGARLSRALGARAPQKQHNLAGAGSPRRPPAWVAVGAAAMVILGLVGSLYALNGGAWLPGARKLPPDPGRVVSMPPPRYMDWTPALADGAATPQQAFAAGMRLTPCLYDPGATPVLGSPFQGAPPKTESITWLFARPNYGIANIQVTCQQQARPVWLWTLALGRDTSGEWQIQGGHIYINHNPFHTEPGAVPTWLELPPGAYDREDVFRGFPAAPGGSPAASMVVWLSQTHMYFLGHVSASEPRPGGATAITVNGRKGWAVEENGMVTVSALLDDRTTFFFSGTGTPAEIEALAPIAFAHMNEALQPLQPLGDGQTPTP